MKVIVLLLRMCVVGSNNVLKSTVLEKFAFYSLTSIMVGLNMKVVTWVLLYLNVCILCKSLWVVEGCPCLQLTICNGGFNMKAIVLLLLMCVVTLSALQSHSPRNDSKDISILDVLVSGSLLCHVMLVVIYLTICNGGFNMKVVIWVLECMILYVYRLLQI